MDRINKIKKRFQSAQLLLIGVAIIWGLNPTIVKIGLEGITSYTFNLARHIVAVIICWIFFLIIEKSWKIERKDIKIVLLLGFLGYFVYQYFYIVGVSHTTAGNTSLIFATLPSIVALINGVFKIEKLNKGIVLGIIISFIGIIQIVVGTGKQISIFDNYFVGNIMIFLGTTTWAIYTIMNKKLLEKYSPIKLSTYGVTVGTIFMILTWPKALFVQNWSIVSIKSILAIIYSGAFSVTIAAILWNLGVKKIGSTRTSLYNNITPIISVLCGILLLNEKFRFLQGVGAILIFGGLYITKEGKIKKTDNNFIDTKKYIVKK